MFLQNLRAKVGARLNGEGEAGFTLIELLVVMLILGILAAIAIPAFFNQRDKASDASAKSMARTAETAMETFSTDHSGVYTGVSDTDLHSIEQTVRTTAEGAEPGNVDPFLTNAEAVGESGYTLTVEAPKTENTFTIARNAATGVVTYSCATEEQGGCPSGGDWAH